VTSAWALSERVDNKGTAHVVKTIRGPAHCSPVHGYDSTDQYPTVPTHANCRTAVPLWMHAADVVNGSRDKFMWMEMSGAYKCRLRSTMRACEMMLGDGVRYYSRRTKAAAREAKPTPNKPKPIGLLRTCTYRWTATVIMYTCSYSWTSLYTWGASEPFARYYWLLHRVTSWLEVWWDL